MANPSGFTTHGCSYRNGKPTPEYKSWQSAKERCFNPNATKYPRYGAIGVTMCERWKNSFETFLADMGPRPDGMTLDRFPKIDGNYEPGNCRWATPKEQANNRKSNLVLTVGHNSKRISEWAAETGISQEIISKRLWMGWTPERAISTPPRRRVA